MSQPSVRGRVRFLSLAAVLAGGSLFGSKCDVRLHDAVFDAGRQTILSIFDPARVAEFFNGQNDEQP